MANDFGQFRPDERPIFVDRKRLRADATIRQLVRRSNTQYVRVYLYTRVVGARVVFILVKKEKRDRWRSSAVVVVLSKRP